MNENLDQKYICEKCGHNFLNKSNLTRHLNKKKPCVNKEIIEKKKEENDRLKGDFNAISLFSGMGGDSLGIVNAGLDLVAYSECKSIFRNTHDENFKNCKLIGSNYDSNILKIPDEEFLKYKDKIKLIFAGFPCQGFSNAGKKDVNDPRNTLFREFLRATRLIKPDYFIGENVKGLLSRKTADNKFYIDVIKEEFEKIEYKVIFKVFKTHEYGIPQKRERLIILGVKKDLNKDIQFPVETNEEVNLKNIIKFNMKGAIKISDEDFAKFKVPEECILTNNENEEDENNPHPYLKSIYSKRNIEYKGKTHNILFSFGKRDSPIHCEIININNPSKTIICTYEHQPRLFVPLKNKNGYYLRCMLPDELKQIQGFPADFKICGNEKEQIIQIGNAVPPPLIEKIIRENISI